MSGTVEFGPSSRAAQDVGGFINDSTAVNFGPSSRAGGFINDSTAVNFVFIRHAQATHNIAAEEHGPSVYSDPAFRDALLTDEGHLQTARVRRERGSEFLGSAGALTPTVIYCSPLRRCQQTLLDVIPDAATWAVRLDDRLMEPQSHVCNHRADRTEVMRDCPSDWNLDGVAAVNPKDAPESVVARIRAFTADILARYPGQRVLVVSHFTWIQNWFRIFKREVVEPSNCAIMTATLVVPHQKLE